MAFLASKECMWGGMSSVSSMTAIHSNRGMRFCVGYGMTCAKKGAREGLESFHLSHRAQFLSINTIPTHKYTTLTLTGMYTYPHIIFNARINPFIIYKSWSFRWHRQAGRQHRQVECCLTNRDVSNTAGSSDRS